MIIALCPVESMSNVITNPKIPSLQSQKKKNIAKGSKYARQAKYLIVEYAKHTSTIHFLEGGKPLKDLPAEV